MQVHKNKQQLQVLNQKRVYQYLFEHRQATKTQMVYDLQLSVPTVTSHLNQLLKEKKIRITDESESTGGRPAMKYQFCNTWRIAIGVEITVSYTRIAALDLYGTVLAEDYLDLPFLEEPYQSRKEGRELFLEMKYMDQPNNIKKGYFELFGKWAGDFIEQLGVAQEAILGMTISIQGIIRNDGETLLYGINTSITRSDFARYFSFPVMLIHDSEAAAIAESWYWSNLTNVIFLSLNPQLGSALILDGKVVHTDNLSSGTIEHIILYPNGKECWCGKRGCVDSYCSSNSLVLRSGESLEQFFEGVRNGTERNVNIWREYKEDLALVIDNLRMMVCCDVLIGGVLEKYMTDQDFQEIIDRIESITTFKTIPPRFYRGHYGEKAAVNGAALTYIIKWLGSEQLF